MLCIILLSLKHNYHQAVLDGIVNKDQLAEKLNHSTEKDNHWCDEDRREGEIYSIPHKSSSYGCAFKVKSNHGCINN